MDDRAMTDEDRAALATFLELRDYFASLDDEEYFKTPAE